MRIYTSNYARKGGDPNAFSVSVGVPIWEPERWCGFHLPQFAPTWDMVKYSKNGSLTNDQYARQYIELLESRNIDLPYILERLPDPVYLLCYESPNDFCHRHILAWWIEHKTGIMVEEWLTPKEQEALYQAEVVDDLLQF